MSFQLDTSGFVMRDEFGHTYRWSDLSPFVQGYVEAMFESQRWDFGRRFSDLAPETLARIIADCERFERDGLWMSSNGKADVGRAFWLHRQSSGSGRFPPLLVTLGADGLIYLGEAA